MNYLEQAKAIWSTEKRSDSYTFFRHNFQWDGTGEPELYITADSTYECAINGHILPIQQIADYPGDRTYSCLKIADKLKAGENEILVGVHYIGEDFLTIQPGVAHLQACIVNGEQVIEKTCSAWQCTSGTPFTAGRACRVSNQLGFVFEYDARKEAAPWGQALEVTVPGSLRLRSVPQLLEGPVQTAILLNYGILHRHAEGETFAQTCQNDFLSARRDHEIFQNAADCKHYYHCKKIELSPETPWTFRKLENFLGADGFYATVDLGHESTGYLTFTLDAPEGTVIDIAHGEHLDDGRVRAWVGRRSFADRYICKAGENHFLFRHRRLGARYLEIHITKCGNEEVTLRELSLVKLEIPLPSAVVFRTEDHFLQRLNDVSIATLKLCMHEHYEDCPWREQGLYAYDSRNQILYGYYVWGNYDFAEAALNLLGMSFDGERYMALTSPGRTGITIPIFTLVWISEVLEHWLHSGSGKLFQRWAGQIDQIINRALADFVPEENALYQSGTGKRIWNFCEWQGELSKLDRHPQSPYNLYLHEAILAAARMHRMSGNLARAGELEAIAEKQGKALSEKFWNEKKKAYALTPSEPADAPDYEHVQAVYLANHLVPEARREQVLEALRSGKLQPLTLSALYYLVNGLQECGQEGRAFLLQRLRGIFEPIIYAGATSIWETANGGDDFSDAGSLCHAWSSVMPYYCGRVLLGVRPLEPGFASFEVKPYAGDLTHAEGSIPTPLGNIEVAWRKNDNGTLSVKVTHPAQLKCVRNAWIECPVRDWKEILI